MVKLAKCPECKSQKIKMENDEIICGKCGLVLSEAIFVGKEMVA